MDLHFPPSDLLGDLWPDITGVLDAPTVQVIADHRAEADRTGRMAPEALAAVRTSGYLGVAIPKEFGGAGMGLHESCAVQRIVAHADPALAIALNMHLFSVGMLLEHWRLTGDHAWLLLEAVARQRRVIASAFAEPGLGGSILRSTCRGRPAEGGYAVSGEKRPCSLAAECDLVCAQFVVEAPGVAPELCVAMIPSDAPGVSSRESWDAMGMRGSASDTLVLDEVLIPSELVYHRTPVGQDSDQVFVAGLGWFCLTTAATYLAIAEKALAVAVASLRKATVGGSSSTRAEAELVQGAVGRVATQLLVLVTALGDQCRAFDSLALTGARFAAAIALKNAAIAHASEATSALAGLMGGPAYASGTEFERLWRDAQAGRFHPPTPLVSERLVGAAILGQDLTFDLSSSRGAAG